MIYSESWDAQIMKPIPWHGLVTDRLLVWSWILMIALCFTGVQYGSTKGVTYLHQNFHFSH